MTKEEIRQKYTDITNELELVKKELGYWGYECNIDETLNSIIEFLEDKIQPCIEKAWKYEENSQ